MREKKFFSVQMIAEAGITLALAYVLSLFKLYKMPFGGSITISMLPIMLYAIRWGASAGFIVGTLFGVLSYMIEPYFVHPIQLLLDYPLPSAFIGLSGLTFMRDKDKFQGYLPFIILSYILKFSCHYFAGVVFFGQYAPEGMSPEYYSFIYNIQYNGPELILFIIVIALLWQPLSTLRRKQK